jgi:hypothetical protein
VADVATRQDPHPPAGRDPDAFHLLAALSLDLDGDGVADAFVQDSAVRAQRAYAVYIRRGTCGNFVGQLPLAESVALAPGRSHGLSNLRITSDECPRSHRMHYCEATLRFDGHAYAVDAERAIDRKRPPPEVDVGDLLDNP